MTPRRTTTKTPPLLLKPEKYRAQKRKELEKRFYAVAEALGFDADGLLQEFMDEWLERLKSRVAAPVKEADLE